MWSVECGKVWYVLYVSMCGSWCVCKGYSICVSLHVLTGRGWILAVRGTQLMLVCEVCGMRHRVCNRRGAPLSDGPGRVFVPCILASC